METLPGFLAFRLFLNKGSFELKSVLLEANESGNVALTEVVRGTTTVSLNASVERSYIWQKMVTDYHDKVVD